MAPIMPMWSSTTTIIIYRKTQRIKKNILVTENQQENYTGAGKEIYNKSIVRLLIIIFIFNIQKLINNNDYSRKNKRNCLMRVFISD